MSGSHRPNAKDGLTHTGGDVEGTPSGSAAALDTACGHWICGLCPVDQVCACAWLAERSEDTCIKPSARTTITAVKYTLPV